MKHHPRRKHSHTCRICSEILHYNTSIIYVHFQSFCFDHMKNQAWRIPRSWKHDQLNPRLQWLSFLQLTQKCDIHIPKWKCKAKHKMSLESSNWHHLISIVQMSTATHVPFTDRMCSYYGSKSTKSLSSYTELVHGLNNALAFYVIQESEF